MVDVIDILSHVALFASLPAAEHAILAREMRRITTKPDAVLFREGDIGYHFYVVVEGQLDILKAIGTNDERLIATQGPGAFIGEMSLLNPDGLRTATARARGVAQLLALSRRGFNALLHRQPMLAYEMVRIMSARLTNAHDVALSDLQSKNRQLAQALEDLKAAQSQLIEQERLGRELELAAEIQMSLLPKRMPTLKGYSFGARLEPARMVGGDLYDFIPLAPRKVGIVIGDVTDKGVPAAIFMAQAHALLHAEAKYGVPPYDVLQSANRLLRAMNASGMFVTTLYGVLDGDTREFAFARAGHEMPLLCDASGKLMPLTRKPAVPLGIWDDPILDEQTLTIPRGGTLFFYTDGVTDAANHAGATYGLAQLQAVLRECRQQNAEALCDSVMQRVIDFSRGVAQTDDITVVAVHVD